MEYIPAAWPVLSGNYLIGNPKSNVAIVTITSKMQFPREICAISGEMKTENLGVERVIINTISNAHIRYIIICGLESKGHFAGQTLMAIHTNGLDEKGRIIGSKGAIPFIENVPREAVARFQKQVKKIINMIGETDMNKIIEMANSMPKDGPYEEGYYVVKQIEEVKKEAILVEGKDVIISNGLYLEPRTFTVC
jgi:tetrahydromethanopterin S-methyltransferase subunit A